MKLIIAYIKPEKLDDVKKSLSDAEVFRMSVTNSLGCGRQRGYVESYLGIASEINLLKKTRLEIAVNEEYVEPTVNALIEGARTGGIGDGKIFVISLDDCIRIGSGETGPVAIG